jgi:hypothetical protein
MPTVRFFMSDNDCCVHSYSKAKTATGFFLMPFNLSKAGDWRKFLYASLWIFIFALVE